uniref:MULE transposase domain-containing protein n=1 Tax=Schizaphis graminum TaxID=13262 RepID=A0A2S2N7Q2_SCHGA
MKQQAKITSKLPGQIFSETVINQPKEVLYQLPCENSIKRTLRNQRTGNHPNDGNCDDLKTLKVEGEWALYHNENLLLHDNGTDAEERILVFGTDNELQLLVDADTWFLDGNFKLAPKPFLQLYVIRIEKNSVYVSTLFILMQNKTRSSYESMFSTILNICKD